MTKDEALAMDLALEALEGLKSIPGGRHELHELNAIHRKHDRAITAIRQARSAPVQEPDAFDCGVYLGDGKDHAIKHHVSYKPAQQEPDHSDELTIAYMSGVHRGKELAVAQAVPDAFGTREGEHPQYIQGWNDCRAEMLKGMKP